MKQDGGTTLHIRCDREDLLASLQVASTVVPSNSARPVLTNILFRATNDQIEILATDSHIGLRIVIRRLEALMAGEAIVSVRQLLSILKESSSSQVELLVSHSDDGRSRLQIILSDGRYTIGTVIGDTFPEIGTFPSHGDQRIVLPGGECEWMLRKTSFAIDKDRSSVVLSGLFFMVEDGSCVMTGTDGKVLSEAVLDCEQFSEVFQAVLPSSTVQHLQRILQHDGSGDVEIQVDKKVVFIRTTIKNKDRDGVGSIQIEITSRLVDGIYPSYRNVLPREPRATITFKTDELHSAVRRTALMVDGTTKGVIIDMVQDQAILRNMVATGGNAEIPITCQNEGSPERIGLNAGNLLNILRVYEQESVSLELNNEGKGIILREPGMTYLIMPITPPKDA